MQEDWFLLLAHFVLSLNEGNGEHFQQVNRKSALCIETF